MNAESAWEKFIRSGKIGDYLSYRSKVSPLPENPLWNAEFSDDVYQGADNEDRSRRNSNPGKRIR